MARLVRWFMYVFAPWIVEQNWFWVPLWPLEWFEYWYSMRERV